MLITIDDLSGDALGYTEGDRILIDVDGAGHGWFTALEGPVAAGRMDLRTVLTQEFGNLMGIADSDPRFAVMNPRLQPGTRLALDPVGAPTAPRPAAAPASDDTLAPPVVINWRGATPPPQAAADPMPAPQAQASNWLVDFVNYLGKSKAEREPNSKIKIVAPAAKPLALEVTQAASKR